MKPTISIYLYCECCSAGAPFLWKLAGRLQDRYKVDINIRNTHKKIEPTIEFNGCNFPAKDWEKEYERCLGVCQIQIER